MAIQDYDTRQPMNLEEAQNFMALLVEHINNIWRQLQSPEFKAKFKSQYEYETWEFNAQKAYAKKTELLKELRAYTKKKWGWEYEKPMELEKAILARRIQAPDWLEVEPALDNVSAADLKVAEAALAEIASEPEKPPLELSVEGQELLWNILNRLRESRLACKMTMTQAASFWGYTGQAISNWEGGTSPVTLLNILKLSQIYNVSPVWILTGDDYLDPRALAELALGLQANLDSLKQIMGA